MRCSSIQLNDLPDEILLIIFRNLNNINLLYSIIGVNKRFNKIVHDSAFTSCLTLFGSLSSGTIYPLPKLMCERFCLQILPEIQHKVNWLDLEPLTMKRILLSANYPNLTGLGIFNIEKETALNLLMDFVCNQLISFKVSLPTIFSSNLLELDVKVQWIEDCLYLLDGRFNQLERFNVNIVSPYSCRNSKINESKLPNLKYFSLYCLSAINFYDKVVSMLHRMSNLKELSLHLSVNCNNKFIDGYDLKQNIINYMPELNQFRFDFRSNISLKDQIDLLSNEDIQYSFKDFTNKKIISYVNYYLEAKQGYCHIYSYPFTARSYENITNKFLGGLFTCVTQVSLFDEHPFEHEFFIRIAQSFPFIKYLTITNRKPQNDKQCKKLKNNNQDLLIIDYSHLKYIDFKDIHDDYLEQFLLDDKTFLPYNIDIFVDYRTLKRVTHNFRRNTTQINCSKAIYQCFDRIVRFPAHFKDYFLDIKLHKI